MAPDAPPARAGSPARIGFLGPEGTFTEEALLSANRTTPAPRSSLRLARRGPRVGRTGRGRPRVHPAGERHRGHRPGHHRQPGLRLRTADPARGGPRHPPPPDGARGTALADVERVASIPMATAQCRRFLTTELPTAELVATNSTAEAARLLGEGDPSLAGRAHGGHRPAAGRRALRTRDPGRGRRGPSGQPDPVRRLGPIGIRHPPATTGPASPASRTPTTRAASTPSSVSSRRATSTWQARVPADQEGPRRLLLHHRLRGPRGRCRGQRLPGRPPRRAGRRQVPGLVSGRRAGRAGDPTPRSTSRAVRAAEWIDGLRAEVAGPES